MRSLKLNVNGEARHFLASGDVAVLENGNMTTKGTWRAHAQGDEALENLIRYSFKGQEQTPVPVQYSFNKANQLVAAIPASANGGVASELCNWAGEIVIDDTHDLIYTLLSEQGTPTGQQITVYGELSFAEETCDLVIDLTGGGKATIKGLKGPNGVSQLMSLENFADAIDANDLLHFVAITTNDLEGTIKKSRARISFQGKWDIDPGTNKLAFVSKVVGDISKPDVMLGFGGQYKAVTGGFAYFADREGTKLAFTISGRHQWNAGKASWRLTLGHSKKEFVATFEGGIEKTTSSGNLFALSGAMTIHHPVGGNTKLDFRVEGTYEFDEKKRLRFMAQVGSGPAGVSYDLRLAGEFIYKGGELSFQVQFTGTPNTRELRLQLAIKSNREAMRTALSLVLDKSPAQVKINFEFAMQMTFVDGELVKGKPRPLTA